MKMDFNDFVRDNAEKYGMDLNELHYLNNKTAILIFRRDEKNNVTARSAGEVIFRDYNTEHIVHENEIWLCTIERASNASYAKPIQKIDASFLFELKRDQIDDLTAKIWELNRSTLEPRLEEMYKEQTERSIAKIAADNKEEYDKKNRELRETIQQLEKTLDEDRSIIESLQSRLKDMDNAGMNSIQSPSTLMTDAGGLFELAKVKVRRTGPDQIFSESFRCSRYFVHVSADSRLMVIRPHEAGNVICVNNTIVLAGLNVLSPFSQEEDMLSDYSVKFGGIGVLLK